MQPIFSVHNRKPIQFSGELIAEGKTPNLFLVYGDKYSSYRFGRLKQGGYFLILQSQIRGIERSYFAKSIVDLCAHTRYAACIPAVIDEVRPYLAEHGDRIYRCIAPVDFQQPFFSFLVEDQTYIHQHPFIAASDHFFIFKSSDQYQILSVDDEVDIVECSELNIATLLSLGYSHHQAIRICVTAGVDQKNIEQVEIKACDSRFTAAHTHTHAYFHQHKYHAIYGILLAECLEASDDIEDYQPDTDRCERVLRYYLDVSNKLLVKTENNLKHSSYTDPQFFFAALPDSALRAKITESLGLPLADDYYGLSMDNLIHAQLQNTHIYLKDDYTVLAQGRIVFDSAQFDVIALDQHQDEAFLVINKLQAHLQYIVVYRGLSSLLSAIQERLSNQQELNTQTLGEAYAEAFEAFDPFNLVETR